MKLVLLGIVLVSALLSVGVACGPKEKYCYLEGDSCDNAQRAKDEAERQRQLAEAGMDGPDSGTAAQN